MKVSRFAADETGVATIELAILSPVMMLVVVGLIDLSSFMMSEMNLRAAVNTAGQMVMGGVTDEDQLADQVLASWTGKPDDATVVVASACACQSVPQVCTVACSDGPMPALHVTVRATGSWTAIFNAPFLNLSQTLQQERTIRVR